MLEIPNGFNTYNILGIDPGLNNLGVSIYKMYNNEIVDINAFTIKVSNVIDITGLDEEDHSERTIKIYKLRYYLNQIIKDSNPYMVICESPFYNPTMPTAYASLVQIIQIVHIACIDYNPNIIFKTIEPLLMKKTIGAGMQKGKIDVKESVKQIPDIMTKLLNDINSLDEHSIDAIAIAYSFLKLHRG